jgi:hypothetical protein
MRFPLRFLAIALPLLLGCSHSTNPFYSISVSVAPATVTLPLSGTQTFTATTLDSTQGVTWTVLESSGGTITSGGLYTAPATAGTYHVVATSVENPTKSATAVVQAVATAQTTLLTATPATSYPGASVLLQPVFSVGTGVISPGVGAVISGQNYPVSPATTTTYTLTITDSQGNQTVVATQVLVRAHGSFGSTGTIGTPRKYHTATLLQDGTVLVAGGLPEDDASASFTVLLEAERYDPATGSFSPVGSMAQARTGHAAVLLQSGKVLLTGGNSTWAPDLATAPIAATNTAELWDPATGQFTALAATMTVPRRNHTATLLANGQVLICGGLEGAALNFGDILASAEIYDPVAGTFTATAAPMTVPRQLHNAQILADGTVLVLGGVAYDTLGNPYGIPNAELFTPGAATPFAATASALSTGRGQPAVALLANGQVFVAGGLGPAETWLQTTEIYTPATTRFSLSALMAQAAQYPVAATLASGQVVVIGEGDTEVFNPAGPSLATVPGVVPTQNGLTATPMANGLVLVVNLGGAELFDPLNP